MEKEVLSMNWAGAFAIFFALAGMALIFHGFPSIKIGGTHTTHNHYNEEYEEE